MNELAGVLNWLRDNISGLLQWLQKYKAGYLVVLLIAARVTWRVYRSVSRRREKAKQALVPTQPGQAALGAIQEIVRMLESDPDTDWSKVNLAALHEHLVNHSPGWEAKAESVADGAVLTATSTDPKEVAHIRGLGFIGLLARGMRHEHSHLARARSG